MRISITKTQATRKKWRGCLTSGLITGLLLCGFGLSVSASESHPSWRDSLVKISLKYETSGVFHEGKFLQSKVTEVTEFQGVIVDARGYILSYVGSHWLKMGSPQSRLIVEFADGTKKEFPGNVLPKNISSKIFTRSGEIERVEFHSQI